MDTWTSREYEDGLMLIKVPGQEIILLPAQARQLAGSINHTQAQMQAKDNKFTPFYMSRFLSVWRCECEYEIASDSGNLYYLWEPLHHPEDKNLDQTARPRWDDEKIVFYREKEKDWVHVNRHLMFCRSASPDVVVLPCGACVAIASAQVVWRNDHWYIRWHGYTNGREALFVAAGMQAWLNA